MSQIKQIQALRKLVPIPLLEAKKLVDIYQGNVESAAEHWKEELLKRLMEATELSPEVAFSILKKHHFDYDKSCRDANYATKDLIELTLDSTKDLFSMLYRVAIVIQKRHNLPPPNYNFYQEAELQGLPEKEYKFYLIWEWINYVQLERQSAVIETSEKVIDILQQLSLYRYVAMIRMMQEDESFFENFKSEFIVESQIGEALVQLMREKKTE